MWGRISIPAPARGRTNGAGYYDFDIVLFQFPPPRGGERLKALSAALDMISIPAPARGRTYVAIRQTEKQKISIPAPARGRTHEWDKVELAVVISIPAPARGRTSQCRPGLHPRWNFNSRPREGANVVVRHGKVHAQIISIPAPARGRTQERFAPALYRPHFNSRPREGANSKTAQNRAVYLVSLLKFGRISAILPYILSATRAKKRETPKIIGFLLRRPTGRSCMEQVGAGGVR